jgi:WD40 repeat protein
MYGLDHPSLAFTPDNQLVVGGQSTEAGAGLTVVDPATGDVVQTIPEARPPMAVSPDGGSVAAGEGDALTIFDLATGARRRVLTRTSRPIAVAFSPDGRTLVSATDQPLIEIWDPASGERTGVLAGHSTTAGAVGFGPDGKTVFSAGADGTVIAWDLTGDRRLVRQIAPPDRTPNSLKTNVAPSPDGTRLGYLYGDQVGLDHFAVRDLGSGPIGPERSSDHPFAGWHDWTPDGRHLVTVGNDRTARLWDPATGELIAERQLPFDSNSGSVGWRPGGDTIFLGLHAGGIVELDAATLDVVGEPLRFDRYVSNVDVSPDGRLLAVELFDPDALVLVDNETREVLAKIEDVDAHWYADHGRLRIAPTRELALDSRCRRLVCGSADRCRDAAARLAACQRRRAQRARPSPLGRCRSAPRTRGQRRRTPLRRRRPHRGARPGLPDRDRHQ